MTSDTKAIVVDSPGSIQRETSREVLDTIIKASRDTSVDVAKLKDLLELQERLLADQRRTAFMSALAELQAELPQIAKAGTILNKEGTGVRNRYAKVEDIDAVVRPICARHGFSFSFDSKSLGIGNAIEFSCDMQHRDGHSIRKTLFLPVDSGPGRNAVQSVGSTTSYARRYLLSMHLNLVTREEDDDGNGGQKPVTADQANELRSKLKEVGGNEARFLNWLASPTFEEIPAGNFARALRFIDEKRGRK